MNTNEQIALLALNQMFQKGYFDICTLDKVIDLLGVVPEREVYAQLRVLHCVDWKVMPTSLYNEVPNMIKRCLGDRSRHRFILADDSPKSILDSTVATLGGTKQLNAPPEPKVPLLSRWLHK